MTALWLYVAAGFVVVCEIKLLRGWRQRDYQPELSDLLGELHPERKTLRYLIANRVIGGTLAFVFAIFFWPVVAGFAIKNWMDTEEIKIVEEPVFQVERQHLLQRESLESIEQRERVFDPLGAVPDLPFGHLHAAWRRFADEVEDQDEIWAFSALWRPDGHRASTRCGYVRIRGGTIGPPFTASVMQVVLSSAQTQTLSR